MVYMVAPSVYNDAKGMPFSFKVLHRPVGRCCVVAVWAGGASFATTLPYAVRIPRDVSPESYLPLNLLYITLILTGLDSSEVPRSNRVLDSDMSCVTLLNTEVPPVLVE